MRAVIWKAMFNDGRIVKEYDDNGVETSFLSVLPEKEKLVGFSLLSNIGGFEREYGIDLTSGVFFLNGIALNIGKEIGGVVFDLSNKGFKYADGIIQYKHSLPVAPGQSFVGVSSYNIGYKVDVSGYVWNDAKNKNELTYVQALLSLSNNGKVSIAITPTFKRTNADGTVVLFRG